MITLGERTLSAFIFYGMTQNETKFRAAYKAWSNGVLELCGEVVGYSELMEQLFNHMAEQFDVPGVYDYEVAEEFGAWFRDHLLAHEGYAPTTQDSEHQIRLLVAKFFHCAGNYPQTYEDVNKAISDFFTRRHNQSSELRLECA